MLRRVPETLHSAPVSDTQLTNDDRKFWMPLPRVTAWVASRIPPNARVLEVGPGRQPFSRATAFVDWLAHGAVSDDRLVRLDFQKEPLPFDDKAFDFVYCRHVLEDLYDPFHLCDEMSRVAKAGYIEVPSPGSEICRGIDGGSPRWRGYHHHRYFVWNHEGVLHFLTKYPLVEYLEFGGDQEIVRIMRQHPLLWNAYLPWEGEIKYRYLQHDIDYQITRNYHEFVATAVNQSLADTRRFASSIGVA